MTADKYNDVLLPFLSLMRKELHANSRKGDRPGWLAVDANALLLEVYWHTAKLSAAVKNNDGPAILEHSADVANMAMMVLDVCGGLAFVEPDPCGVEAYGPRKATDAQVQAWAERHDLGVSLSTAREIFEDAQTLVPAGEPGPRGETLPPADADGGRR